MRILIAEDDPISRKVLESTLSKWGYEVTVTKDGMEALRGLSDENAPQLAVLDWMMPGMDGVEVVKKIREKETESHIYTILLTALERKEDVAAGLDAGADDYVTKPFNAKELRSRIRVGERMIMLQNTLADHVRRLRQLDELKTNFLSVVSHELRTPIAVMREGISLCLDGIAGELTDMQRELLTDTFDNSDRLLRLVTDLLDISKIEAGKVKLYRESLDLREVIRKMEKLFEHQTSQKGVRLVADVPDAPILVFADKDKLTQIFSNYVSNAIRFTEAGGEIRMTAEDGDIVRCGVTDTGIGISEEGQKRLFSKFEQVGRVEGPGYKGTGLGLAIVKGLVEKHGGEVFVRSKPGEGSTFGFTLPKGPFPRILIVDDEPAIVDSVQKVLSAEGYRFSTAGDGEEAIEKVFSDSVDAVILDMNLPKMNGYEIIGRLKQDGRTQGIGILILSGYTVDEDELDKVKDHSAIPVLEKPFSADKIRKEVRKLLLNLG
jgi:two-component system, sensor histidine kinase and response regulator